MSSGDDIRAGAQSASSPEFDQQIVTDILVGIDDALAANGREPMDAIDGPTVDDLRDVVEREVKPLWSEVERRERILREAVNGDDSGDFDAVVVCVRAIDEVRADLVDEVERLRCALDAIANFDPFQGGPIAPRSTPTEQRMRSIAREALSGLSSKKDQP